MKIDEIIIEADSVPDSGVFAKTNKEEGTKVFQAMMELIKIIGHLIKNEVHNTPKGGSELQMSIDAVAEAWSVDPDLLFKMAQKFLWKEVGVVIVLPVEDNEPEL